ncbi:hypothetical protein LTR97_003914 [Elasticomyces elasticus]|uniref:Myb-like domain-containing protein n=1 Tax=Elasticomyces elasticus TaxID=574655 RepID=A0AAN7W8M2_9PEZI|nr:hypothetical protein LTR97_003914 [Elasticomyces elasticus]
MAPVVIDLVSSSDEDTPKIRPSAPIRKHRPHQETTVANRYQDARGNPTHGLAIAAPILGGVRDQPRSINSRTAGPKAHAGASRVPVTYLQRDHAQQPKTTGQSQPSSSRPGFAPAPAHANRIDHFESFHARETLRHRKPSNGIKETVIARRESPVPPSVPSQANREEGDLPREPLIHGAGFAILDDPPNITENPRKCMAPSPGTSSRLPLVKRLRTDNKPLALDLRTSESLSNDSSESSSGSSSGTCSDSSSESTDGADRHEINDTGPAIQLTQELESALVPDTNLHSADERYDMLATNKGDESVRAVDNIPTAHKEVTPTAARSVAGQPYTEDDNVLISRLRETEGRSWDEIMLYFPGRSKASLNTHFSTKVKGRHGAAAQNAAVRQRRSLPVPQASTVIKKATRTVTQQITCRSRGGGPSALEGFVPWSKVGQHVLEDVEAAASEQDNIAAGTRVQQDRAYPSTPARILRQRELGMVGSRAWASAVKRIPDELVNHTLRHYASTRHFMSTCGDVTTLAWRTGGDRFAVGSIAITDDRSMQYNSGRNLMIGDNNTAVLQELQEHRTTRPIVDDDNNPNALRSMRATQSPHLYQTVAAVGFSPDGDRLYSIGSDRKLRAYGCTDTVEGTHYLYEVSHSASVDLLSISRQGLIATACHSSADDNVQVWRCDADGHSNLQKLSPGRTDGASSLPIFPSALKWGLNGRQSGYLLAGFSSDSNDEERDSAGETALWNAETGQRSSLSTICRNTFDVAWNCLASIGSTAFCVASTPGAGRSSVERRSVVQCYAPEQNRARQVLEWECPAFDINDVMYCPYDENLIAAGATDGKVYVWDTRFASQNQKVLHTLNHGGSINVLDHDRDQERIDTGVRMLCWGATSSRLYSGSSDGVVKVWNPYRCPSDAFVEDVATLQSAVMSGAFSPDYRQLLVGEESGRLDLLSMGQDTEDGPAPLSRPFRLNAVEAEDVSEPPFIAARVMLKSKQIEIRQMGDLPIRQAVQGPAYHGPYFKPSAGEVIEAQEKLERCLKARRELHARLEGSTSDHKEHTVDQQLEAAQETLMTLQAREDSYDELNVAAIANQRTFRNASKRRMSQVEDYCKLKCNYLPAEIDGDVPDSHRSQQRIPGALRALPQGSKDITELDCDGFFKAGLAEQCKLCSARSLSSRTMKNPFCRQRCNNIRAQLAGSCQSCAAPVRTSTAAKGSSRQLCERCGFTCFRCLRRLQLPAAGSSVQQICCEECSLAWDVDILGYNLVENIAPGRHHGKIGDVEEEQDSELFHYHSRWQTSQH